MILLIKICNTLTTNNGYASNGICIRYITYIMFSYANCENFPHGVNIYTHCGYIFLSLFMVLFLFDYH